MFLVWLKEKGLSTLASMLLALAVFALSGSALLRYTVFTPAFMKKQIDQTGYVDKLLPELQNRLTMHALANGFPVDFFDDVFEAVMVEADVRQAGEALFNREALPDMTYIRGKMKRQFTAFLENEGVEITDEIEADLCILASECAKDYLDYILLPYNKQISSFIPTAIKALNFLLICSGAGVLFFLAVLTLLNRYRHRVWRYAAYACAATGVWLMLIPLALYAYVDIRTVAILSRAQYDLIQGFYTTFCTTVLFVGALWLPVAAGLAWLAYCRKKKMMAALTEAADV